MPRRPSTRTALLALSATPATLWGATELAAQDLLSAADVVAMEAPAPDHTLAYGSGPLQYGHLRLPHGQGPHPVVLFIHGGCWLAEYDIGHVGLLEDGLARAGYAVWSLEYRRVGDPGGGWPGTFQDVAAGADHLRSLAEEYALDLNRVVAAGHSAGGHLALWLAARPKLAPSAELHAPDPLEVGGVLGLAPAPALGQLHESAVCGEVIDGLMGGGPDEVPERYAQASPMLLAPIGVPQTLVIGSRDRSWGPVGLAYHRSAVEAGDSLVELVEAPESGHFEMIVPGTSTWPLVMDALAGLFERIAGSP